MGLMGLGVLRGLMPYNDYGIKELLQNRSDTDTRILPTQFALIPRGSIVVPF